MGKRSGKKYHKNPKGKTGTKRVKPQGQWNVTAIPQDHPLFREYYERQLGLEKEDFQQFWAAMKEKLPVVFRVNPNCANFQAFLSKIGDEGFMRGIIGGEEVGEKVEKQEIEGEKIESKQQMYEPKELPKLELIKWYPGNIVYTLNTTKQTFKKSKILAQFHKFLQKSFDSGLVSRQQLVSMLPPLYLNIQSDDIVLDLCAAPGSKTSQILEMIYGERRWLAKGCVIANDADYSRAQMLIHQLHRSGTTGMAVINHPGQFLPELSVNKVGSIRQKFLFDKILCDVPCSGDGATRKLPIKWAKWHTSDGMILHPLQLAILMKAINLLKKGGYLVYSTCSLNPIENEAVVNALFQKVGKGLELVDIHSMFGVKGRRGLLDWKVLSITEVYEKGEGKEDKTEKQEKTEKMQQQIKPKERKQRVLKQFSTYQQAKQNKKVRPSMFPPTLQQAKKIGLDHTMRILPHDQNSGGFYVALLRKTPEFEWKYSVNQKKKMEEKGEAELEEQFLKANLPEVDEQVPNEDGEDKKEENWQNQNENQEEDSDEDDGDRDNDNQQKNVEEKIQKMQVQKQKEKEIVQKADIKKIIIPNNNNTSKKKNKGSKYETYHNIGEEDFQNLQKFYGLAEAFKKLLYVRSSDGQNASKKVLLVSEGVRKFLEYDTSNKIKLVNMGIQVFQKGKQSFAGNQCLYRLCQDGIHFILDYLQMRKIRVSFQFFKKAISIKSLPHEQIQDQHIKQQMRDTTQGSFCIYIDQEIGGRRVVDALVGQNFKNSFHLMVSKEDQASLTIRYL